MQEDVDELQSIYGHLRDAESSPGQISDQRAIRARLDKLMSMIERLGGATQAFEGGADGNAPTASRAAESMLIEEEHTGNAPANRATTSRPSSPRRAAADSSSDEFPIPSGQATDLVDPVGSLNLGHLSLEDGGRSR